MDNNSSHLNYLVFIITTILYFLVKPDPNIKTADGKDPEGEGSSSSYMMTGAYFLVVILSQFFINSYVVTTTCGGNVTNNMKEAALYTFFPWILIFGVTIVTIVAYPAIKSGFSDVVGYYLVSGPAQIILTELLKGNVDSANPNTNPVLPNVLPNPVLPNVLPNPVLPNQNPVLANQNPVLPNQNPVLAGGKKIYKGGADPEEVSDLVLKIYGNMSILINQLTPSNFNYYWDNMLTPLFKDTYKLDPSLAETKKNDLVKLVITRDNIGEGMWYIYTGILICSLVQFKLSSVGCKSNQEVLAAIYKKLKKDEKNASAINAESVSNA